MATSTNYGWAEPDNTSLVKDGAQAIRTLGDAIDTSVWNVGYGQAGKNAVINGALQVWQRGTTFPFAGQVFTADRFYCTRAGAAGGTASRQTSGLTGFNYSIRVQRDSGNTSTSPLYLAYNLETANSYRFAGQSITFSFYAKAGANYSSVGGGLTAIVQSGTGVDQSVNTGFTGSVNVINSTATLTTSWQRFSFTGTVGSTATQLGFYFQASMAGTAGANDWFEVTGVQLELGAKATPFATASGGSIQGELAMCQRYYVRTLSNQLSSNYGLGLGNSATQTYFQVNVPEMRVSPTVIDYSTLEASDGSASVAFTNLTINAGNSTARVAFLIGTHSSGITQYRPYLLRNNASTSGFLGLGAEL
jgi:hypothetical protein